MRAGPDQTLIRTLASLLRGVLLALVFVASTAVFTNAAIYPDIRGHVLRQAAAGALALLVVLAAGRTGWGAAAYGRLTTLLQRSGSFGERRFVAAVALLFFVAALLCSWLLFRHIPHVSDSQAQYVGAKILASGHLWLPSGALGDFFDMQYMVNNGRFYGSYPPGHMLLLAAGHLAHAPWLVNPLLGTLTVISIHQLAREIADAATARIAAGLALCCTFMLYMSSEYMNHVTTLLCCTLALLYYFRTLRRGRSGDALLLGVAVGYGLLTRPQSVLPFALPLALHAAWLLATDWSRRWKSLLWALPGVLLFVAALLVYNQLTNGNPFLMGYLVGRGDAVRVNAIWSNLLSGEAGIGHKDLVRMVEQTGELQEQLFKWPTFSLLFVLLLCLFRSLQRPGSRLILWCCLSLGLSLLINPWNGQIFGPRYLYEAAGGLIVLTALALRRLPALLRAWLPGQIRRPALRGGVATYVLLLFIVGVPLLQVRAWQRYAHHYYEGNVDYYQSILQSVQSPAVVFVKGFDTPDAGWAYPLYRYVSFTLPLEDSAPVLFARDLRERNAEFMQAYPSRHPYLADESGVRPLAAR